MASTTLILRDPKAENETRVICLLRDGREIRIKIYSDISIKPKHWSTKNKYVLSANQNAVDLNKQLLEFKQKVLNIYNHAVNKGLIPTKEYIQDELRPKVEAISKNKSFWNVWGYFLEAKKNYLNPSSIKKFNTIEKHLKSFEKYDKRPLDLDVVTGETLERLQNYFFQELNFQIRTSSKYIKIVKMFLNWAVEKLYTKNFSYKSFKPLKAPDTLKIVFTADEINRIEALNLNNSYLLNARELLILSTLTGLRFSDYSRISKEHVKIDSDDTKVLLIRQQKTKDYVELPLTPRAEGIINKLIKGEVHAISNQKLNNYVKHVCKLAEVDSLIEVHEDRGKLTITKKQYKYELVSTHTGRRTFCTNLLLKGVPHDIVMLFSGHKDYKSFKQYVNIPKQTEKNIIKNALLG